MKVESITCIRGGARKRWLVLDTVQAMGRECVSIGSTKPWLHTLLAGNMSMSNYYHAINNFVADCFDAVNRGKRGPPGSAKNVPPVPLQDKPDGGAASSQGMKRGRAAIFGVDDEPEDPPNAIVQRKRRLRAKVATGFATVKVRNIEILCYCRRGRQLLVPVGTDDLDRIVQHLIARAGEGPRPTPGGFADLLERTDENYITWRIARRPRTASSQAVGSASPVGHWTVHYTDKDGKACETTIGLGVPKVSLTGDHLALQEQMQAARLLLVRARREWNRLDCSSSSRFQVPCKAS